MKNQLIDRMSAQRAIVRAANSLRHREPLMGLSHDAIERWLSSNSIRRDSLESIYVMQAAAELVTLKNKSQDEITLDYGNAAYNMKKIEQSIYALAE